MKTVVLVALILRISCAWIHGQSADWQEVVFREPQVRYLLTDISLHGGKTDCSGALGLYFQGQPFECCNPSREDLTMNPEEE